MMKDTARLVKKGDKHFVSVLTEREGLLNIYNVSARNNKRQITMHKQTLETLYNISPDNRQVVYSYRLDNRIEIRTEQAYKLFKKSSEYKEDNYIYETHSKVIVSSTDPYKAHYTCSFFIIIIDNVYRITKENRVVKTYYYDDYMLVVFEKDKKSVPRSSNKKKGSADNE